MRSRSITGRRFILWIALLALGLHALVPVGYMPDFSKSGLPGLVFCDGEDHHAHSGDMPCHAHKHPCPFGVSAVFGLAGIKAPAIVPPQYAVSAAAIPTSAPPEVSAPFGNASPRSPPFFS